MRPLVDSVSFSRRVEMAAEIAGCPGHGMADRRDHPAWDLRSTGVVQEDGLPGKGWKFRAYSVDRKVCHVMLAHAATQRITGLSRESHP